MKKYCPLMTIGFSPPEPGQRDMRLCMKDCMWYNQDNETCAVNIISDHIQDLSVTVYDIYNTMLTVNDIDPEYIDECPDDLRKYM